MNDDEKRLVYGSINQSTHHISSKTFQRIMPDDVSLAQPLDYEPVALKFGTSGRQGEIRHLTQLEVYTNVFAELEYLQSLPLERDGIRSGESFIA